MSKAAWRRLNREVVSCQRCPRLVTHCQQVATEKRRAYQNQNYWGKPVPDFGSLPADLLIVGLAPGAHGANRTGRMFTGDRSGEWLYRALHRAGFANQQHAEHCRDGLKLNNAVITNVARCAPPGNRPTADELARCESYFLQTMSIVRPKVMVALGQVAWNCCLKAAVELQWYVKPKKRPSFGHAHEVPLNQGLTLIGSYHPSQQNTFTGRLTEPMLDHVFRRSVELLNTES